MIDVVDKVTRSRMMAAIKFKDTVPELKLRKALHNKGLRFRLHDAKLAGRPDIVFARYKAVCFVHGCFWHQHFGCRFASSPQTRPEFWKAKFAANVSRDIRNQDILLSEGWKVATVWECALNTTDLELTVKVLIRWLHIEEAVIDIGKSW